LKIFGKIMTRMTSLANYLGGTVCILLGWTMYLNKDEPLFLLLALYGVLLVNFGEILDRLRHIERRTFGSMVLNVSKIIEKKEKENEQLEKE